MMLSAESDTMGTFENFLLFGAKKYSNARVPLPMASVIVMDPLQV